MSGGSFCAHLSASLAKRIAFADSGFRLTATTTEGRALSETKLGVANRIGSVATAPQPPPTCETGMMGVADSLHAYLEP